MSQVGIRLIHEKHILIIISCRGKYYYFKHYYIKHYGQ